MRPPQAVNVAVSIDTEADHGGRAWVRGDPLRFRSVVQGVPDLLSPLFRSFGVRPTYLLSAEVLDDPASVEVLARLRDAELGTHLHGDHVPPATSQRPAGTASVDFASHYPEDLERAKLATITDLFADRFGRRPRAYRAGRYAASGRTACILTDLGYHADGSVTPGIMWTNERHPEQRIDFRGAPRGPYHPSARDLAQRGDLPIVEVPITIVPRPPWWDGAVMLAQRAVGRRPSRYPVWLRPSTTSWPWLRWAAGSVLREDGRAWIHVMFHSVEMIPDASPYSRTVEDAARVFRRLSRLLAFLARQGASFRTLSEVAALFDASPDGARSEAPRGAGGGPR